MNWSGLDEAALAGVAQALGRVMGSSGIVYLEGDLGAGKSTFVRALLGARGVGERIKSPTYSLIETYPVAGNSAHHLDLYRIANADELEWLGLPDLLDESTLLLVEWPERAAGALPPPDLRVLLQHAGSRRDLALESCTATAGKWLSDLEMNTPGLPSRSC